MRRDYHHLSGTASPQDELTQLHVPFQVPAGSTAIHVKYAFTGKEEGNAVDLGLFGVDKLFRGYSGGSKTEVTVSNDYATPGYIPGLLQPGEWYVLLGLYTINTDTLKWDIEISFDDSPRPVFEPLPAPVRAQYQGSLRSLPGEKKTAQWLKGDLHMHTLYSDGHFTLDELVKKAQKRGLDFIFSTEHNTYSANMTWGRHAPKGFLVGRGIEVTTKGGHWNAIGLLPEQYINPLIEDMDDKDADLVPAVEEVHKSDGFAIINHCFADCKCCQWTYSFHDSMDAIEVWNGPWRRYPGDQQNEKALQKWNELLRSKKIFTGTGGSDIHEDKFEIAEPCTHILSEENTVSSLIRSMRARHVYITQHPQYKIDFSLTGQSGETVGIGDWLRSTREVMAHVRLKGFPDKFEVSILTDARVVHRSPKSDINVLVQGSYVRIEVRSEQGDMLGLTNPIWILDGTESFT